MTTMKNAKLYRTQKEDERGGLSQQEIADILGVSRARVSFLERQALKKLRKVAEEQGLTLEVLLQ
jgi:DNA-directed RNA polymerase specialized sigma subunit